MTVKVCPVCGTQVKCKIKIANGCICPSCARLSPNFSSETIDALAGYLREQNKRRTVFSLTRVIKSFLCDSICVDDCNKLFYVGQEKDAAPVIYRFDEVLGYEMEPQVKTVTKKKGELGRAVVGGALFGGVGAVVGASTAKEVVTTQQNGLAYLHLQLKTYAGRITLTLYSPPIGAASFFNICTDENRPTDTDWAEELLKYKKLLDGGVITQEQFDAKKKDMLGL